MDLSSALSAILSPAALFFFLGFGAVLLRSDLEIPAPLPKLFSIYLLLAIGYTGGAKLAAAGWSGDVLLVIAAAMGMALLVPFYTFFVLRRMLGVADAAAMAATYGSISVVTFVVATDFLANQGIAYGGHMVAVMSLMETPAIIAGILLYRLFGEARPAGAPALSAGWLLRESFLNGSVYLLLGSLLIGYLTGNAASKSLGPFMNDLFKGVVILFLLDTGMLAARKAGHLLAVGPRLVIFGVLAPVANGLLGTGLAYVLGLEKGDAFLFAVLCASGSYIVVPAAMRQAIPEANPGLFELLSLSITFPWNVMVGLPAGFLLIQRLWGGA